MMYATCWRGWIVTCQEGEDTEESVRCARSTRLACVTVCKWIPVLLVWMVIAWIYYAYVFLVCLGAVDDDTEKVSYLVVSHILLLMMIWAYVRTSFVDYSNIPKQFYLTEEQVVDLKNEVTWAKRRMMLETYAASHDLQTTNKDGDVRYCEKCQCVKPDRCHHCSICGRCVLKMDHHCPWMNNCIGYYNYKFFILFIVYALMCLAFIAATTVRFTVRVFQCGQDMGYEEASVLVLQFLCLFLFIVNASFLVFHFYLITRNTTTIETFFPPVFKAGSDATFNVGCAHNYREIFGRNALLWFLPVSTREGDGIKFLINTSGETGSDVTKTDVTELQ